MRGRKVIVVILIVLGSHGGTRASQAYTATAILDAQVGPASLRTGSKGKETQLKPEKDLGRILWPRQELRCGKNCRLEVLLCTGNRVTLEAKDGWYRIPSLDCEKEQWTPGFKNYLMPGGRRARYARPDPDKSERLALHVDLWGQILNGIDGGPKGAAVGGVIHSWYHLTTDALNNRACPKEYGAWVFDYPHEGDLVVPSLLAFNIRRRYDFASDLDVVFEFTLFDDESKSDPVRIREDVITFKGSIAETQIHPARNLQEFLSKSARKSRIRIFWTVTVSSSEKTGRPSLTQHTFGSEFFVASSKEETEVIRELTEADKSTGITRFLARAEIFENLGLWDRAIDEYRKALSLSPENDSIKPRLEALTSAECYRPSSR